MRFLITGGAGYIGSVLCQELLQECHSVVVVDNFMYNQTSLNHLCQYRSTFEVHKADARDASIMAPLLKHCDVFIPLAALVGAPLCDQDVSAAWSTNVDAIKMACNWLGYNQKVLIPISNSGYGIGEKDQECTETSPLNPVSLYGKTKVWAEKTALDHRNTISFRLATVFGMSPRMRTDLLVNDFVLRAFRDRAVTLFEADFRRNYIHVRDVADVFASHWKLKLKPGEVYNVGLSSANLSKRQLCAKIKEHLPEFVYLEAPIGEDKDKRDYIVSNAKLEATGWLPQWSLDDGIVELIKGYRMMRAHAYGNV